MSIQEFKKGLRQAGLGIPLNAGEERRSEELLAKLMARAAELEAMHGMSPGQAAGRALAEMVNGDELEFSDEEKAAFIEWVNEQMSEGNS